MISKHHHVSPGLFFNASCLPASSTGLSALWWFITLKALPLEAQKRRNAMLKWISSKWTFLIKFYSYSYDFFTNNNHGSISIRDLTMIHSYFIINLEQARANDLSLLSTLKGLATMPSQMIMIDIVNKWERLGCKLK